MRDPDLPARRSGSHAPFERPPEPILDRISNTASGRLIPPSRNWRYRSRSSRYTDEDGMPDIRADFLIPSPDLIAARSRTVAGDDKDRYISEHLQSGVASIN
jgi:hypothetical protein